MSCASTLTRACKPMTRSDSTVLATRPSHDCDTDSSRKNFRWLDKIDSDTSL